MNPRPIKTEPGTRCAPSAKRSERGRPAVRILGIDPGLAATGYGCLEQGANGVAVIAAGVISTPSAALIERRLASIYAAIDALLEQHAPSLVTVEDLYTEYRFPRMAILMGHARGVICLAAARRGVAVLPVAPAEVKRHITANGAASKLQVQRGVQERLRLRELPRPSHVADALSLALTGLSRVLGRVQ